MCVGQVRWWPPCCTFSPGARCGEEDEEEWLYTQKNNNRVNVNDSREPSMGAGVGSMGEAGQKNFLT